MRYWVISFIGLALCGAAIVALDWGIWHLMLTGSCASGGPYVSARPCPPGTAAHILSVMGGVFGGLIGTGIYATRGRSDQRRDSRYPLGLAMWTLLFCTIAGSALYATLGPAAGKDAPKGTAIFLAALFIPMGLAPMLTLLGRRGPMTARMQMRVQPAQAAALANVLEQVAEHQTSHTPSTPPPTPPPTPSKKADEEDPIAKIERLAKLRDKGVITEAEFEVEKARLLREV
jgi:hypothetical protein